MKFLQIKSLLFILLTSFILTNCTTPKKPPVKASPDLQAEFQRAKKEIAAGKKKRGLKRLDKVMKLGQSSDIADDAALLSGRTLYKSRDFEGAYNKFIQIQKSEFFSPDEGEALLWAARSLSRLGRFDEALALSGKSLKVKGLQKEIRHENFKLRFQIFSQLGQHLEALRALTQLVEAEKNKEKKRRYQIQASEYVDSRLSEKDLYEVARDSDFGAIRTNAKFRYASILFEQRDFSSARGYFSDVISEKPGTDLAERSRAMITQIDARRTVDPKTVGVILPLTGRHSSIAYRSLRGIQLGLGIYGPNSSNLKLAIVDSEGNPDLARKAVEKLVTDDNVVGILGSLLSKTAVAVASKSDELGVPSIGLSQKSGLTDVGDSVFRNSLTSEMQVRKLVQLAMGPMGFKRFAILYPNDRYGTEYANLFWNEVRARGGKISGAQSYPSKGTDFAGPIKRLVGTYYLEDRQAEYKKRLREWKAKTGAVNARTRPPEDLLPPVVDFDAIFVPDSIRAASQIAPSLKYLDISGVPLIGTNLWNVGGRKVDPVLNGSVFVDSFLTSDPNYTGSQFFREYKNTFKMDPGLFEAQAYDAALVLRQALAAGERSRSGVSSYLKRLGHFSGAVGKLKLSPRREFARPLVALTFSEGEVKRLKKVKRKTRNQ